MHLYLHVPFCQRRCSYCDFSIAVRKRIPADEYVHAVLSEWGSADPGAVPRGERTRSVATDRVPDPDTIYFGGGTPSLLPPAAIATLLRELMGSTEFMGSAEPGPAARGESEIALAARGESEITLEANPEDVTPDNAKAW